jgi:mannose-6-phosphate isomerase-like protein (cupin superfamily)
MPGATLVTRLKVYDTDSPDGQRGGTPHFHFMCTEMYFLLAGTGAVEMIDHNGFTIAELRPHSALIFSPGTLHRLINPNRDMELLVIMQNSGLPERGDNVVCFNPEILGDEQKFADAMKVVTVEDAYRRRDLGVEGFNQIKAAFQKSPAKGRAALDKFYALAAARTKSLRKQWKQIVQHGALAEAQISLRHLADLAKNDTRYLHNAQHHLIHAADYSKPGFCGTLNRYFDPATLMPEGVAKK